MISGGFSDLWNRFYCMCVLSVCGGLLPVGRPYTTLYSAVACAHRTRAHATGARFIRDKCVSYIIYFLR